MSFCAVSLAVPGAVALVIVDEKERRIVLFEVLANQIRYDLVVFAMLLDDSEIVLDDSNVDGIPVDDRRKGRVGSIFANNAENRREKTVFRVGTLTRDSIGQSVKFRRDAVKHRAPALCADRRIGRQNLVAYSAVFHDALEIGHIRVLKERAAAVDANEDDALDAVRSAVIFRRRRWRRQKTEGENSARERER